MPGHSLNLTRTIRDPIQGAIRLTSEEIEVVNHPLFRRLHRVKQNGLLFLVFPSAKHTRFEHSLGALNVADCILEALHANAVVARHKPTAAVFPMDDAVVGTAVDFSEFNEHTLKELFRLVRLAALAHDMGHGPFSHYFDPFAPRIDDLTGLIKGEERFGAFRTLLDDKPAEEPELWGSSAPTRVKHDVMSCLLFSEVWWNLKGEPSVAQNVTAVVLGRPELCEDEDLSPFIPLLHDIVASAPADADRMDYLERDSRALGVSYGLYDRSRLLKSFLAYKAAADPPVFRLGVKLSGARAVENFIQARFELFVQIYYHKTNRAVLLMLSDIVQRAEKTDAKVFDWSSIDSVREVYEDLSDERFLTVLRGKDQRWHVEDPEINATAEDIYQRRLWKRVFDGDIETSRFLLEKLREHYREDLFILDQVSPQATKDLDGGARLLRRGGDGVYTLHEKTWLEQSPIISALANEEKAITRLFIRSYDPALANEIRLRVWEWGH